MPKCVTESIKQFAESVEYSIKHNLKRSIYCDGPSGIGKSQVVQQIAEKYFGGDNYDGELSPEERKAMGMGDGWVDLRLLLYSETDLKGIPYPSDDKKTTIWLANSILPNITKNGSRGVLIAEELPAAARKVKTLAYQLCEDRKLGDYVLPDGWFIVALGNRQEDGGEFGQMPPALANRFEMHSATCTLDAWKKDYAIPAGINPLVLAYLNENETDLHTYNENMEGDVFASPRSWKSVSDLLNTVDLSKGEKYHPVIWRKVSGNVGDIIASGLEKYAELGDSIVKAEDILSGKPYVHPDRDDALFMVLGALTSAVYKMTKEAGDIDSTSLLSDEVKKRITNALQFVATLNDPVKASIGFRDLQSTSPELMDEFIRLEFDSDELNDFISNNCDILV